MSLHFQFIVIEERVKLAFPSKVFISFFSLYNFSNFIYLPDVNVDMKQIIL